VHFIGLHYIILSQGTVQKTKKNYLIFLRLYFEFTSPARRVSGLRMSFASDKHSGAYSTHTIEMKRGFIRYVADVKNSALYLRSVLRFLLPCRVPYRDKKSIHSWTGK